ncbi:MAG TPA: asparagine synthase (glutamine-hydrolyzing) [Candidatus Dormibacteraeota bacterium]|nr:asparagine synthase (glutamine-hydrolyzing) [Candidatus Dormibacteraeota bacterium]
MCGIYGIAGRQNAADLALAAAMDERLRHRGPDDTGRRESPLGVCGMRRLAIIDLSSGSQPMVNEAGDRWVTLNGEIYNYRELRRELEARGHRFRTHSDTEVVLHGYEAFGDGVVDRLRGMFAIAVWDERKQRLLLARDRVGKKPLYYALRSGRLIFASELKALLADPSVSREIDRRALWHYLTFKNVPAPLSIFSDVRTLPPGHLAVFSEGELAIREYWRPSFTGTTALGEEEAAARLLEILREAVRLRVLASDVPVGAYLSGGIDSSLIVALMAELGGTRLATFSLGYADRVAHKSDVEYARMMARRLGTEHHEIIVSTDEIAAELPAVVRAFDEPFAGTISSFWLSRAIASHVKVALSGDGADELFGSYANHRMAAVVARLRATPEPAAGDFGSFAQARDLALTAMREPEHLWRTRFAAFTDAQKRELLADGDAGFESSADFLAPFYRDADPHDVVNATLEVDCRTLLPDQVLTYVDRLSMAHSLEVRAPFLDHELVEFAGSLPGSMKVGVDRTKAVLKLAARRYLPAEIVDRKKEGFVLPIDAWLNDRLRPLLAETLSKPALDHGLFRPAAVQRLLDEHAAGANHTYRIWTLLMFQLWHRDYAAGQTYRPMDVLSQEVA